MYKKNYNIFLLISNISRNLLETFSIALLYKLNYNIKQILLYYLIFYLTGIIVNILVTYLSNYIKFKYILILSNILFVLSYYYFNIMPKSLKNLIIFSIMTSFSSFTYHLIRHYFAIKYTSKTDKEIGNILIFTILGISLSSYIGAYIIEKYSLLTNIIIVFIISIISIIPIKKINLESNYEKIQNINISKNKQLFFFIEQSKVLFLLFEPLYLYIYISSKLIIIGLFNLLVTLSSIITIYIIVRKVNLKNKFKYINIIFVLILLLKLNIKNSNTILIITFLEGLFTKAYEIISMKNLYQEKTNKTKSYLLKAEIIFCFSRSVFILLFYIFTQNIKLILYILLIFIFLSGFILKKDSVK